MTPAETALHSLARDRGLRITACNSLNANVGEIANSQIRLWHQDRRAVLRATDTLLEIDLRLRDNVLPPFSVNRPDQVMALRHRTSGLDAVLPWPVFTSHKSDATIAAWMLADGHARLLSALSLGKRDSVHVYQNRIVGICDPSRDVMTFLSHLAAIGDHLATISRATSVVPESSYQLPEDLKPLQRLFARWTVGDDEERSERIARARPAQVTKLRAIVEPLMPRIDAYLASLGDPFPDEAVQLGQLAELVAELRARGDK